MEGGTAGDMQLYPNLTNGLLSLYGVTAGKETMTRQIFSPDMRLLKTILVSGGRLSLEGPDTGLHFIKVFDGKGSKVFKIWKQ
ncbi:T9SS type A sorting domain-containing protein [Chitinophaga pendula]|uniref:T9SS type A sorting domain-containing protein n=1 Tax=Chitinophaga TaxID=79328 RepID=UPI000BAF033E|nr:MULTISPECIES: T9SS type A sorting domain-containing protein [Chitinophaga]ASZ10182.1 hypothetical protein CK934_03885 [Chitinophaga sp. MD30]UCJ06863.1 T9SS type A sorting domain-containing protein [Chitinophaga pendula]